MKRLIVLGTVLFLCLSVAVYAASIGGAETQGKGNKAIGLDQEFIFDKDMKYKGGTDENLDVHKVEIDQMYRSMAKISYGLLDNLDVYVKLGTADAKIKSLATYNLLQGTYTAKTSNAFAYGLGMKGAYPLENDWLLGCDVQYLRHKHDADSSFRNDKWNEKLLFQEWQVAPYLAKKLGNFTPYLGVKYSDLRLRAKDNEGDIYKYKAKDNVGMFLGTDYKLKKNWKLNLEGRFIDETAVSIACVYRF